MAEVFIALGTALGGGAAAGTTAATATAATATTASTISTALTIGTALASVAAGFAAKGQAVAQAAGLRAQEAQTKAQGAQERASLAEEYAEITADQTAVQLANGLNPHVGTPATIRTATREFAERNISTARENTRNRTRVMRLQRRALLAEGNAALFQGVMGAGTAGLQGAQLVG